MAITAGRTTPSGFAVNPSAWRGMASNSQLCQTDSSVYLGELLKNGIGDSSSSVHPHLGLPLSLRKKEKGL
jgi:hypothetical protein